MDQFPIKKKTKQFRKLSLSDLPVDDIPHILEWLDFKDLLALGRVSKLFKHVCCDDSLWKKFAISFGLTNCGNVGVGPVLNW